MHVAVDAFLTIAISVASIAGLITDDHLPSSRPIIAQGCRAALRRLPAAMASRFMMRRVHGARYVDRVRFIGPALVVATPLALASLREICTSINRITLLIFSIDTFCAHKKCSRRLY
ncbi:hypothetical protein ACOGYG_001094 [Edwardsiella piscicida]|uniref:hypothetical protein n=1 Tax=Edwardsiella piscicida TaxID=1263550 RepID=UPI001CF151DD|nr:hypothetical protein [Edwardsiella piscicida]UCQ25948.1 hypothetical protein DCE91_08120 [Edwardsiella piscicida]UCQ36091.1 hypothetical protein DCF34_08115 [Edwardsiella piscicida]UJT80551.1 hypothetical protein L1P06_08455 [Edwardsiella piscicida]